MKRYRMQMIFGLPVLIWTMAMITMDTKGWIDVEPFGYAFFGGLIALFVNYFFRKAPPGKEALGEQEKEHQPDHPAS